MSLPNLPAGDKFRREVRTEWGGINLNENAGDGELIEAMNMSSREYPLLATARISKSEAPVDIAAVFTYDGKLGYEWNMGNGDGYSLIDPTRPNDSWWIGDSPTRQFAIMGSRMIMLSDDPNGRDKQIYDFDTGTLSKMASTFDSGAATVVFKNGTLGGVPADGNTIYCEGVDWASYFSVGDAVSISGSNLDSNNKTAIIREIDGDELHFDENCFSDTETYWHLYTYESMPAGSSYYFYTGSSTWLGFTLVATVPAGVMLELHGATLQYLSPPPHPQVVAVATTYTGGTPSGTEITMLPPANSDHVTIARTIPDMDYICVNENRVWGCKGDTIYASKLGDPLNWNVYDGLSTDSWTTETGTPGDFTGCCSYQGYPTFFKENAVFKVLGDEPKNFVLRKQNIIGARSNASIVEVRGKLYYWSHVGVMEWNGGDYPTIISGALGLNPGQVDSDFPTAGTDYVRYYIQLSPYRHDRENENVEYFWYPGVYVYDTRFGTWHMLEINNAIRYGKRVLFAGGGRYGWMIKDWHSYQSAYHPYIYALHSFLSLKDTTTPWQVTFADSTRAYKTALTGSESKKGVLRLLIRCRLTGSMAVWISYDGGDFEKAAEFEEMNKTSKVVPLILRRCDFWQLRLTGTGDAVIYSIAVEKYGGEWQQA